MSDKSNSSDIDESEQAAKKQKTGKISRLRKSTDRFGLRENETNDDALFDDVHSKIQTEHAEEPTLTASNDGKSDGSATSVASATSPITNNSLMSVMTPGEKILFEEIMRLKKEVTVLQKNVVGIEVKLDERLIPASETPEFEKLDDDELQVLGLPLSNQSGLAEFESKLKQKDFYAQVVSK